MNAATILQRVEEAGVVGAGGAGFPTHVKLKGRAEWLICNGAECEPLLYSDQALMEGYAAELVRGLELAREATGARHVVIALKGKYAQAHARRSPSRRPGPGLNSSSSTTSTRPATSRSSCSR